MTKSKTETFIDEAERYGAHNYHPLPIVIESGEGAWVTDVEGRRYLDCLSAYSAVNQGHRHPKIVAALKAQADRITLTSRAFHNDRMGGFLADLCRIAGAEMALPMNSGAEAVETALKAARKWGYEKRGIPPDEAEIVTVAENFHGRTISIVSFSTEDQYRRGFGPFTPGFRTVPFGDLAALRAAIGPRTVAFLAEPIQGEAGVMIPPAGYLAEAAALCRAAGVVTIWDEIQSGLGRTGKLFAYEHDGEGAKPDLLVLGKALSGGVYPVSAVVGRAEVLGVFRPGDHGSTYGGNPLASAVAQAALGVLVDEDLVGNSARLGRKLAEGLGAISSSLVKEIRVRGLWAGIELHESAGPARAYCLKLVERGVLAKDTRAQVIRLAPPLVIGENELEFLLTAVRAVLA
ncbi:MAG: ornithine--oxo-acid transaminase [Bdellovibrionales bacterium]|nr:ornithine--oxo-acid transaminase [Bdellovibrionales bacterium]